MTVSHIIMILSACDFFDDLKIIESIGEDFRRYSYHLHDGDVIIKRWDNAPHWKDVRTYPFHMHIKDQENPLESKEMFVSDVIEELKKLVFESEKKELVEETLRKLDIGNEDMRELEKIRGEVWKKEKKKHLKK